MKRSLLAAVLAVSPVAASAQEFTTYIGFAIVSDYVSGGFSQTNGGPAFQPYIEVEHSSGFYAGLWASNVDFAPDDIEIDLYAGYRGEAGAISYDIGYFRYFYDNTGDCCGELIAAVSYNLGENVSMTTAFSADFEGAAALKQSFEVSMPDSFSIPGLTISGDVKVRKDDYTSWTLGIGKSITDTVGLDIRYHDSELTDPIYTVGLSFDTTLGGN